MSRLIPVHEFIKAEPHLGGKDNVYFHIREGHIGNCPVRIGRRVYADSARWEQFKATGGQADTAHAAA